MLAPPRLLRRIAGMARQVGHATGLVGHAAERSCYPLTFKAAALGDSRDPRLGGREDQSIRDTPRRSGPISLALAGLTWCLQQNTHQSVLDAEQPDGAHDAATAERQNRVTSNGP